jgi:hypothetical protein
MAEIALPEGALDEIAPLMTGEDENPLSGAAKTPLCVNFRRAWFR